MMGSRGWRTPVVILVCATLILMVTFGARQTYGLFLAPISTGNGWSIGVFSFAMALQTLVWGISQPFWGNVADRLGAGRVIGAGALLYAAGLWCMSISSTPAEITLSTGLLTGLGMSATGFPIILAVVGRSVPAARRGLFLGIASAGGSSGQVIMVPFAQHFITANGYAAALVSLAIIMAVIAPLTAAVAGRPRPAEGRAAAQSTSDAIREARAHKGYLLLVTGFFVCGFQTMFIGAHLPNVLKDGGIDAGVAASALATIGLFNIFGCFIWGALGDRYSRKYLLASLYVIRAVGIMVFISLPMTETSALLFSAFMGLNWLGTVPLTSGMVAQIFGTRYMATLYGFAFLSHQIGSFLGIWLGGEVYDLTGSYSAIWWGTIGLGFAAALLHWPIDERPVARLANQGLQ